MPIEERPNVRTSADDDEVPKRNCTKNTALVDVPIEERPEANGDTVPPKVSNFEDEDYRPIVRRSSKIIASADEDYHPYETRRSTSVIEVANRPATHRPHY
jgi:hypothetical protein